MKKTALGIIVLFLITCLSTLAYADLANFLSELNAQAQDDLNNYTEKLGNQFGIPLLQVQDIINVVEEPADAFMVLQLGQMTNKEPDTVLEQYERNKGKGWGVIAKELGIKPGSAEFHALKRGDFSFTGVPGGSTGTGQGKDKGKDKDKEKGKGHNK
jgi:hypothetical protein